jgi:hypothetical protein
MSAAVNSVLVIDDASAECECVPHTAPVRPICKERHLEFFSFKASKILATVSPLSIAFPSVASKKE